MGGINGQDQGHERNFLFLLFSFFIMYIHMPTLFVVPFFICRFPCSPPVNPSQPPVPYPSSPKRSAPRTPIPISFRTVSTYVHLICTFDMLSFRPFLFFFISVCICNSSSSYACLPIYLFQLLVLFSFFLCNIFGFLDNSTK